MKSAFEETNKLLTQIIFTKADGSEKTVSFFNERKAIAFYQRLQESQIVTKVKKKTIIISANQAKKIIENLRRK